MDDNLRHLGLISSAHEAFEFVHTLFLTQIQKAQDERTLPNASVSGDGAARQAFLMLLEPADQRVLFLRILRDTRSFPRIRSLVGSPPFSFLRREDDQLLRAAGITRNRAHLAFEEQTALSSCEFARGHFEDGVGRMYKVIARKQRVDTPPFQHLSAGEDVIIDVRLPRRTTKAKQSIVQKKTSVAEMLSLTFPRAGEVVRLQRVAALRVPLGFGAHAEEDPNEVKIAVRGGRQRERNSPVARLVVNVV